jgi:hypothetical protein
LFTQPCWDGTAVPITRFFHAAELGGLPFEFRRVVRVRPSLMWKEVQWVNSQHMKLMTVEELMPQVKEDKCFLE